MGSLSLTRLKTVLPNLVSPASFLPPTVGSFIKMGTINPAMPRRRLLEYALSFGYSWQPLTKLTVVQLGIDAQEIPRSSKTFQSDYQHVNRCDEPAKHLLSLDSNLRDMLRILVSINKQ